MFPKYFSYLTQSFQEVNAHALEKTSTNNKDQQEPGGHNL